MANQALNKITHFRRIQPLCRSHLINHPIRQNVYTERIIIYTICIDKIVSFIQCEYSKIYHLYKIGQCNKTTPRNMFVPFRRQNVEHKLDKVHYPVSVIYEERSNKCSWWTFIVGEQMGFTPIISSGARHRVCSFSPLIHAH